MGQNLTHPNKSAAIIIVAFNDAPNLERCLPSLKKDLNSKEYTVHLTVVDNSTKRDSKQQIKKIVDSVTRAIYIDPKNNTGFAGGNNIALKHEFSSGTDYCILLNSDTEIYKGQLTDLIKAQAGSAAALVGPSIVYGDDPQTYWYGGGRWQSFLGIVRHNLRNQPVRKQLTTTVTFVNGAAMLIPKSTFIKYGGFFEPYFMYYEDSDYSVQLVRAGEHLLYEPKVVIKHYVPPISEKSTFSIFYLTRNHWLFWVRTSSGLARLTACLSICMFQLVRFISYILKTDKRSAILKAWSEALNHKYGKTFTTT